MKKLGNQYGFTKFNNKPILNPNFTVTTLLDVEDFIRIKGHDNTVYYGGNQLWYGKNTLGHRGGCGTVAVANILTYLAKKDMQNKNLYKNKIEDISKAEFINHMKRIYEYVTPQEIKLGFINPILIGIPLISKLQKDTKAYALKQGVNLITNSSNNILNTMDTLVDFIRDSLKEDNPLAMLVWFNKRLKNIDYFSPDGSVSKEDFARHWVTITGLSENKKTQEKYILVSSWGGRAFIKLNDLYSGGLVFLVNFKARS